MVRSSERLASAAAGQIESVGPFCIRFWSIPRAPSENEPFTHRRFARPRQACTRSDLPASARPVKEKQEKKERKKGEEEKEKKRKKDRNGLS